jgi:hypothetical protein
VYLEDWKTVNQYFGIPSAQDVLLSIMKTLPEENDIVSWELGLENGCAGYGLEQILL